MQSGCIASRLSAVSTSVSPFATDEDETEMLTASAERRLAASSNEVRVRVEFSKNEIDDGFSPESRDFFDLARIDLAEIFGSV